jgi:hypothetical protein
MPLSSASPQSPRVFLFCFFTLSLGCLTDTMEKSWHHSFLLTSTDTWESFKGLFICPKWSNLNGRPGVECLVGNRKGDLASARGGRKDLRTILIQTPDGSRSEHDLVQSYIIVAAVLGAHFRNAMNRLESGTAEHTDKFQAIFHAKLILGFIEAVKKADPIMAVDWNFAPVAWWWQVAKNAPVISTQQIVDHVMKMKMRGETPWPEPVNDLLKFPRE